MSVSHAESTSGEVDSKALEQTKLDLSPSARRKLAEQYIALAKTLAQPYKKRDPNESDTIDSVAMEALVDAANDFDPVRFPDQKFGNWLKSKVRSRFSGWARSESLRKSRHEEYVDRENSIEACDGPVEIAIRNEEVLAARERAEGLLDAMPENAAEALRMVCAEGLSRREAAEAMGACRTSLYHYLTRGKRIARGEETWEKEGKGKTPRSEDGRFAAAADYTASVEWVCDHAGVVRVHEPPHGRIGDPYVWSCTVKRSECGTVATLKGVCMLPHPKMIKAMDDVLRLCGILRRKHERRNGRNNRVVDKALR